MLRYLRVLEPSKKTWLPNGLPWEELMLDKAFSKKLSNVRLGIPLKFLYQLARAITVEHVTFEPIVDQHITPVGQNQMMYICEITQADHWELNMVLQ